MPSHDYRRGRITTIVRQRVIAKRVIACYRLFSRSGVEVGKQLGRPVNRDMCCRGAMASMPTRANNIRYIGVCTYLGSK